MGFHSDFQKMRARPLTLHGQSSCIEAPNCIHPHMVFGREREGGASGTEAASLAILLLCLPYALWRAGGVAAGVALGEKTGG